MWSRTGACAVDNAIGGLPTRRADTRIRPSIAWTSPRREFGGLAQCGSQQVNNRRIAAQIRPRDRVERAGGGRTMVWFFQSSSQSARTYPDQRRRGVDRSRSRDASTSENGSSDSARGWSAPEDARPRPSAPQPSGSPRLHVSEENAECAVCFEPLCAAPAAVFVRQSRSSRRRRRTCSHFFHLTCAKDVAEHHRSCPVCRALPGRPPRAEPSRRPRRGSPPSTPTATGNSPPRWSRCSGGSSVRLASHRAPDRSTARCSTLGPRRRWVHRALGDGPTGGLLDFVRRNPHAPRPPPPPSSSRRWFRHWTKAATVPTKTVTRASQDVPTARRSATGERDPRGGGRGLSFLTPTGRRVDRNEFRQGRIGRDPWPASARDDVDASARDVRRGRSWVTTSPRVATRAVVGDDVDARRSGG